ncbi:MAG: 16S rRNA (cytosine(1402)-N(4))-methyltransferase RsmH [Deltaproteobacteria bacterium]|jgi:16S rRNA (cytosine1402-N4)-methyltransferase|nr:16S rRNA (cytosine(1402)-N(4))-methyltransferase RsmH [Deltaproteobacteria bacterium]
MKPDAPAHVPVLAGELTELLLPRPGGRYLDATLGLGGHAALLLQAAGPGAELLGLDRDRRALNLAGINLARFGRALHTAHLPFADFAAALENLGWDKVDGALVDAGVSSLQLDTAERGFSFMRDGPLDMRLDSETGMNAAQLLNSLGEKELESILKKFGEEPMAGRIARAVAQSRAVRPLERTGDLAALVEKAYPPSWRAKARNHPATRTFQALRLAVNDELGQLRLFMERIVPRLNPGARVAIISFHSLEDRLVKHFFRTEAAGCLCPPHVRRCLCGHRPTLRLITKKALTPGEAELAANPRARSAKLRVAERLPEPAPPLAQPT